MPIYEYKCNSCNERQEVIQRFSDAPLAHCPKCGGEMKKLISSPAIQFKGSGFYKTDYAAAPKSSGGNSEGTDGKSESKTESKTEAKTEAKTEVKAESKSDGKAS